LVELLDQAVRQDAVRGVPVGVERLRGVAPADGEPPVDEAPVDERAVEPLPEVAAAMVDGQAADAQHFGVEARRRRVVTLAVIHGGVHHLEKALIGGEYLP